MAFALAGLLIAACSKESEKPEQPQPVGPVLLEPTANQEVELDPVDLDGTLNFAWSAASLEKGARIEYVLRACRPAPEGGGPTVVKLGRVAETTLALKHQAAYELLVVQMGAPEDGESEIALCVTAYSAKYPEGIESPRVGIRVKPLVSHYSEFLYFVGDHQAWRPETAKGIKHIGQGRYEGFVMLKNPNDPVCNFRMTSTRTWNGINIGMAGDASLNPSGEYIQPLKANQRAPNITFPSDYYRVQVDLAEMQLKALPIRTVSLYGACNGWTDTPLSYDDSNDIWYLHGSALPAAGEGFRIRCNNSGDISLGGDLNNLTASGNNITVSEAANYDLSLDIASRPYRLTLAKK